MRINLGCGRHQLPGWINIDVDPDVPADLHARVPPLPFGNETAEEFYLGHLLEHLTAPDGRALLSECWRALGTGGRLGVVVPDTREILTRYVQQVDTPLSLAGHDWDISDLDAVNALFLYSTVQETPHLWSYDATTLCRLLSECGFQDFVPIDRWKDPRLAAGVWWQCGWDGVKCR